MSRIGKKPVALPNGVKASMAGDVLSVEGAKGKLDLTIREGIKLNIGDSELQCTLDGAATSEMKAHHGLLRSLIANMVKGVSEGYTKELEVVGVGYRAAVKGKDLELSLGFSHPVTFAIPEGVTIAVDKLTTIKISGADRQQVGEVAAEIRKYRLPEPYKGKGVKYKDETVRRKAGKAAVGSGG